MMNLWIPDWQPWGNDFDEGKYRPWYAYYDYVEYWEYVPEDQWDDYPIANEYHPFRHTWTDEFKSFDDSRWLVMDGHTFGGNRCTFLKD